jgi:hypothetical protein
MHSSAARFQAETALISGRLHHDPAYNAFDAMADMSTLTGDYLYGEFGEEQDEVLAGGSLGRREMLPNSDVDLFVISDRLSRGRASGLDASFDKVEAACVTHEHASRLARLTLVDGNRLIDARHIAGLPNDETVPMLRVANTLDRQMTNVISEWNYFRSFDYQSKAHATYGENIKYSNGSSRDVVFINWLYRMHSGTLPYTDLAADQPELELAADYFAIPDYLKQAIGLVLMVKNAAVENYTTKENWRLRYINGLSMANIYAACRDKLLELGVSDRPDFIEVYAAARTSIEEYVDQVVAEVSQEWSAALEESPKQSELVESLELASSGAEIAFYAWELVNGGVDSSVAQRAFNYLQAVGFPECWGGMMALACNPSAEDDTLWEMAEWLYANEPGAYLLKLVSRNPNTTSTQQHIFRQYYEKKEVMK